MIVNYATLKHDKPIHFFVRLLQFCCNCMLLHLCEPYNGNFTALRFWTRSLLPGCHRQRRLLDLHSEVWTSVVCMVCVHACCSYVLQCSANLHQSHRHCRSGMSSRRNSYI